MNQTKPGNHTPYKRKLLWRKVRMYLMWALTFVACLIVSLSAFNRRFFEISDPQIRSTYSQIAKVMPALEANENSLFEAYKGLVNSREEAGRMGIIPSRDTIAESKPARDLLKNSLSLERITHMTMGHNGIVAVALKDTGKIVAVPNESEIGKTLMVSSINSRDIVNTEGNSLVTSIVNYKGVPDLDLNSFADEKEAQKINLRHLFLFSSDDGSFKLSSLGSIVFGTIVPYGSLYIVCAVDLWDYLLYISRAVFISVIACVLLWLLVHYISLMLDKHELDGKDLRRQLVAYSLVLALAVFGLSWYVQVLNKVTTDLNAMQSCSDSGVSALESFQDTQRRINSWFDEQYLTQCRIARDYVKSKGTENITREDLADLSAKLRVQHVYVYNREGRVIVTNSPYDHFKLSDDPDKPSHSFLPLLEGADHVILQPMPDEISGSRCQLIGVCLRNEEDKADGFVQISIDPSLRDFLTQPMGVDSVLTDMTVGLPEAAIAVDKSNLTISATTGFGYVGQSIEDFGYNADKLKTTRSGFLRRGGKVYYAGFGETEKYYLIPIAERTRSAAAFTISLRITLVVLVGLALILLMALYRYQSDVADAVPPQEQIAEGPAQTAASPAQSAISGLVNAPMKRGFDKRWHVNAPKAELTPGERVKTIAYRLLVIFCAWNILPLIYDSLSNSDVRLSGLPFVLFGNWEKGVNIFAFTSCLFLLFALYLFMSVISRVLYNIAKVSNMRVETICLLLRSSLKYVCVIAFIYYGLSKFGIPTQALLASAGIITLAVSIGAKTMVEDIIAGFFLLLEGNFMVGDYITVGNWTGTVQEIGLRTTRISSGQGTKICNNSSIRDIINNDQEVASVSLKLPVGLEASLAELEELLKAELPELMSDVPGMVSAPVYGGVDGIEDGCMLLSISCEVKSGKQGLAKRELNRRLMLMFERHGIRIPS